MAEEQLLEHAAFLRRLVSGLVLDANRVDDVVQETYLRALSQSPRHARNVRGWLAAIARNLAYRLHRDAARRADREARSRRPRPDPPADDAAARAEIHRKLAEAVAKLDEPYRSAVVGRYLDGLPPKELAARLDVPVKTVKSRIHRGLATLRARLDRDYGDRASWSLLLLPLGLPKPGGAVVAGAAVLTMKKIVAALVALSLLVLWIGHDVRRSHEAGGTARRAESAPARAPAPERAQPPPADETPDQGSFVFSGRVVDRDGAGVPDARVRLLYWSSEESDPLPHLGDRRIRRARERKDVPDAVSGADGRFRFDRPWSSRSYLRVDAEGYGAVVAGPFEPRDGIEIVIERGWKFAVVDPEGAPVPGALVRIVPVTRIQRYGTRNRIAERRTGPGGAVELPHIGARDLLLEVAPREPDLGFVSVPLDGDPPARVTVPRLETRTHRIVDAETGAPIPDAYAMVSYSGFTTRSSEQELVRRHIAADAGGVIRFPLQEDYYGHLVTAPGYDAQSLDRDVVPLHRSARVEGVVFQAGGAPLCGAAILIANIQGAGSRCFANLPLVAAWSDADGRFEVEIKLLGGVRSIVALHRDHGCAVVDDVSAEPGARSAITLRIPRPATVAIETVGADGAPRTGYWASIRRRIPAEPEPEDRRHAYGLNVSWLLGEWLRTGADGRTAAHRLPPGTYDVDVKGRRRTLKLQEGETREMRLVFGAGPSVTGRLLDENGEPRAGVNVGLSGPKHEIDQTDAEGRFRFEDLEDGAYEVGFHSRRANAWVKVAARPGGDEVVLREPSALARLTIVVDGPPPGTAEYWYATARGSAYPPGGPRALEPDGTVTPTFEPSKGVVFVRAKGHGWRAVPFEAAEGEPAVVRVRLPRAGAVEGTVDRYLLSGDGPLHVYLAPLAETPDVEGKLALHMGDLRPHAKVSDGRFRIEDVPPGAYRATLYRLDGRMWVPLHRTPSLDVVSGNATALDITR